MADSNSPPSEDRRNAARKRAQNHFAASEARDQAVHQMLDKEHASRDAKIAKLRALRLAKEAADAEEARLNPPPAPAKTAGPKKARKPAKA